MAAAQWQRPIPFTPVTESIMVLLPPLVGDCYLIDYNTLTKILLQILRVVNQKVKYFGLKIWLGGTWYFQFNRGMYGRYKCWIIKSLIRLQINTLFDFVRYLNGPCSFV